VIIALLIAVLFWDTTRTRVKVLDCWRSASGPSEHG
jgi:hypothetical protein